MKLRRPPKLRSVKQCLKPKKMLSRHVMNLKRSKGQTWRVIPYEKRILAREENIDRKAEAVEKKENSLAQKENAIEKQKAKIDELQAKNYRNLKGFQD